jgi:predicted RNase H-like HicB family nuclease
MKYVYPAIFHEENGTYIVEIPDLPGAKTYGTDLSDAMFMAKDAAESWLLSAEEKHEKVPFARKADDFKLTNDNFINLILADTDSFRYFQPHHDVMVNSKKAGVKLTIPKTESDNELPMPYINAIKNFM